jgi:transposase-like protein
MPFELGLPLGLRASGGELANHTVLILERQKYTCQKCLSDISGQDLQAHRGEVDQMILQVRNWLRTETGRDLPGPKQISEALQNFRAMLPRTCESAGISREDVPFTELVSIQMQFLSSANHDG